MKKLVLPFILLILLSLFACQQNDNKLTFAGEGNYWSAEFTANQTEYIETYEIQLHYKGKNIEEIQTFHYNLKSHNGVIDYKEKNARLNKEGIFKKKLLGENSHSTRAEEILVIEIQWKDKSELFNLKP